MNIRKTLDNGPNLFGAEDTERKDAYRAERERYAAALGLTHNGSFADKGTLIEEYAMPSDEPFQDDRRVLILIHPDGSWRPYLDIGPRPPIPPTDRVAYRAGRTLDMAAAPVNRYTGFPRS